MRNTKEIGEFITFGIYNKTNQAYKTYASIYLDIIDDSIDKFFMKGKDIEPIKNITGKNPNPYFDAFINTSLEIIKENIKKFNSVEDILTKYPLMKIKKEELEALFAI